MAKMDSDEYVKVIDNIYKNILDKFNPGARQMINAGKAYLKALHGSAAASNLYIESVAKMARDAQQGPYGASTDVGNTLMRAVDVCKEIQDQQMNILKAFYVDLLLPLETNLEKDTKVVQLEQKRFLHQHKQCTELYNKAVSTMKKQRKKSRSTSKNGHGMDKELKSMQNLEEEKTKLDGFCERSLKNALTQERRRYGFVLERQCSLAKHYYSFYNQATNLYEKNIEDWNEVAKTREVLPNKIDKEISNNGQIWPSSPPEDIYSNPNSNSGGHHRRYNNIDDDDDYSTRLRKSRSMDTSCLDLRSKMDDTVNEFQSLNVKNNRNSISVYHHNGTSALHNGNSNHVNGHGLIRAKSEFNLTSTVPPNSDLDEENNFVTKAKNSNSPSKKLEIPIARALYAYLSSGENQLTFLEGDIIALIGERNKGWQYGENLRTQSSGWFPLAYTEILDECISSSSVTYRVPEQQQQSNYVNGNGNERNHLGHTKYQNNQNHHQQQQQYSSESENNDNLETNSTKSNAHVERTRMFGDTFNLSKLSANVKQSGNDQLCSPPSLPAPVPNHCGKLQNIRKSVSVSSSLHSSNDSGFINDQQQHLSLDKIDEDDSTIKRIPLKNDNSYYKSRTLSPPLVTNPNYFQPIETDHKKYGIKRTKSSFWKFGRNSSESEILEGMAMWKHRDLMDTIKATKSPYLGCDSNEKMNYNYVPPSDDESEKTLTLTSNSSNRNLNLGLTRNGADDGEFENQFQNGDCQNSKMVLKTVNRREILQKYNNRSLASSGSLSSSSSSLSLESSVNELRHRDAIENTTVTIAAATTTTVTKSKAKMVNSVATGNKNVVAEIGKKLEIMSKSMQGGVNSGGSNGQTRVRRSYIGPDDRNITSDYDYDYDNDADDRDGDDNNNNNYYFINGNHSDKRMQFLPRISSQKKSNCNGGGGGGGGGVGSHNDNGGGGDDIYGAWCDLWDENSRKSLMKSK